jgi:hypothetical protein
MSELAFNANGENFEISAVATGWRVRRLKPRGAPELVYGRDGRPLTIPIESDMTDLREAVGGVVGRYRLDPINDDGKAVEGTSAAYIQVVKAEQPEAQPSTVIRYEDDVLREAMRLNTELAKAIVDRFPEMLQASAELLRAADGAGMPSRQPLPTESEVDEATPASAFDLNTLVAQLVPLLMPSLSKGKLKMPELVSMLDWRKGTPALGAPQEIATEQTHAMRLPSIDPATMAHFVAVQAALSPQEAAHAREVATELKPAELRAWFDELKKLSVPDAGQKIRGLIAARRD